MQAETESKFWPTAEKSVRLSGLVWFGLGGGGEGAKGGVSGGQDNPIFKDMSF